MCRVDWPKPGMIGPSLGCWGLRLNENDTRCSWVLFDEGSTYDILFHQLFYLPWHLSSFNPSSQGGTAHLRATRAFC
ncbi:hypothetical protein EMIT0194MI4_160038 [Pseudomonas sp. IT-194MI4]